MQSNFQRVPEQSGWCFRGFPRPQAPGPGREPAIRIGPEAACCLSSMLRFPREPCSSAVLKLGALCNRGPCGCGGDKMEATGSGGGGGL